MKPCRIIDVEANSQEWMDLRSGIPTASEFKRFHTPALGEYASEKAILNYALELITGESSEHVTSDMYYGSAMESKAVREYEIMNNVKVRRDVFLLSECGRYGGSPDGLVNDDGGLEVKCPASKTHLRWLYYFKTEGAMPIEHKPQVSGLLGQSGRKWWDFMSYHEIYESFIVRVTPDDYMVKVGENLGWFLQDLDKIKELLF